MIFTSYFANSKNFPKFRKTVSTSRFPPKWFKPDIQANELAPSIALLNGYKEGKINDSQYKEIYLKENLSVLDPKVIAEKYKDGIFLCFEKKEDFCHRQIISEWLNEAGFPTQELITKKTRIAVIGSRSFTDYETFKKILKKLISNYSNVVIVSGKAKGTDSLAKKFALEFEIEFEGLDADWDAHGKSAGFKSNIDIWNASDFGLGFWDGKSSGTKDSFDISKKQNKDFFVYNYIKNIWIKDN